MTGILEQTRSIPEHPLAAAVGGVVGGWIPYVSIRYSHELGAFDWRDWHWVAVLGALVFSAITVFEWMSACFENTLKAVGFTVVTETVMICSHDPWLHWPALAILILINATNSAYLISREETGEVEPEMLPAPEMPALLTADPVGELANGLAKVRASRRQRAGMTVTT